MAIISLGLRDIKMAEQIILAGNSHKQMVAHQDRWENAKTKKPATAANRITELKINI